ncbi:alkyl hydroperoxide reductase subunit F [Parasphingorhabdus sp.]|uniref:alkyl hydroperoxide reductase subunit F n=1 Tax=Parasphingorhabdus sp. TaxID=2709688 RepID=UPI003D2A3154
MPVIDQSTADQLKTYLANLRRPIRLIATLDDSVKSAEMKELVETIAPLSELVTVDLTGSASRAPSFLISADDGQSEVEFAGLPLGHEFSSLILALLHVGGHPPKEDAELLESVATLEGTYHFETFFSLSCQNCPDVIQALNIMAARNPNVSHVAIDGALFQDEVEKRKIMAVPTVFLNGEPFGSGRMNLSEIMARVDTGSADKAAKKLSAQAPYDVLVVGGGPAGAAAAIYTARKGIRTAIIAEQFGGQLMDTMGIENFISVPYTEGPRLTAELERHVQEYDLDVFSQQRISELVRPSEKGALFALTTESGGSLKAKAVILATGARWKTIGVPGEAEYRNKGVAYCPHCDGPLYKGKRVAVIGGGNSGVEAAIDLAGIVSHVTLIEYDNQLRADAVLQKKMHSLPNVTAIVSAQTTEILGDEEKVNGLRYKDRESQDEHDVELEGAFVQIGLVPNSEWLGNVVAKSAYGEIEIDHRCETSVPGIFAAGDVTTVPYKQIVISMGEGSKAALSAFDYLIRADG